MNIDRIDFISAYCDRWCERCAYTSRCSSYAVEIATAMCGDFEQGLELAVGRPHPVDGPKADPPDWLAELENVTLTPQEEAEYGRRETARAARIDAAPLSRMSWTYLKLTHRWLTDRFEEARATADPLLAEALDIVMHDSTLVGAKLYRALAGRDRQQHDGDRADDPVDHVQNDWNGSAKVAVLSLQRSEAAWRAIGDALPDRHASALADAAQRLCQAALQEFPGAMSFVRPGFDEPGR